MARLIHFISFGVRRFRCSYAPARRIAGALTALCVLIGAPHSIRAASPFVGAKALEFVDPSPTPLQMPTGVAVFQDGTVYVADGVHDRIVVFDAQGRVVERIREVQGQKLSRPVNVAVDAEGQLWIADTGNARVLVRGKDGGLVRTIAPPREGAAKAPEITDIALTADGKAAYLVDNHNHRLLRYDVAGGQTTAEGGRAPSGHTTAEGGRAPSSSTAEGGRAPSGGMLSSIGAKGESLGEFHHPFMAAVTSNGSVFVTDVMNGRVDQFTEFGRAAGTLSAFGVEVGELYRPKGIERDGKDNVWVSDSVMGVIQVFTASDVFIDVLRDASGQPLRFRSPMGLAMDSAGALYVVELGGNCVSKVALTIGPIPPSVRPGEPARGRAGSPDAGRPHITGGQARSCTVCHLEWMEPLSRGTRTELVALPENPPDHPHVSRAETCLSCHDSSVVDSRRAVWQEHGHRTGVKPKEGMVVPPNLPLVDGKIACRTCHSAHSNGQFQGDASTAVFLRAENSAGELCVGCHADKTRGPKLGTHPTGGMPWAIPKSLIEAGAKSGPNPRQLTCTVCHRPHGSVNDHLLVMGTGSNQLCLSCHDQMRPGMFREGGQTEHPLTPVVNAEQREAIQRLGTKLGSEDRLICLSCHKLHHGKGERFMLAEELTDGRFCTNCHSDKESVFETSHDLRVKFPEEKNRLGMTPSSGGPCSACHMFHRYARAPEISEVDPGGGKCITCHEKGRCAESKSLPAVNHPKTECVACHDPHQMKQEHFLRAPAGELCIKCHADYTAVDRGPHDFRNGSERWPAAAVAAGDRCMACHRPHGDAKSLLFRTQPAQAEAARDGACLVCHSDVSWRGAGRLAALHPRRGELLKDGVNMPLVGAQDGESIVGCATCHNPHLANGKESKFVRAKAGEAGSTMCVTCHTNQSAIASTSHSQGRMAQTGLQSEACLPCHTMHGETGSVQKRLMWPKSLAQVVAVVGGAQPPSAVSSDGASNAKSASRPDPYCTACHRDGGAAKPPMIASHPDVTMFNQLAAADFGSLPLFDVSGGVDSRGTISCRTCHVPHGHWPDEQLAKLVGDQTEPGAARGARLMLRPFAAPNVCTTCHGADARRRFLYFHDPQRRSGPLTDPTAGTSLGGGLLGAR